MREIFLLLLIYHITMTIQKSTISFTEVRSSIFKLLIKKTNQITGIKHQRLSVASLFGKTSLTILLVFFHKLAYTSNFEENICLIQTVNQIEVCIKTIQKSQLERYNRPNFQF